MFRINEAQRWECKESWEILERGAWTCALNINTVQANCPTSLAGNLTAAAATAAAAAIARTFLRPGFIIYVSFCQEKLRF